MSIKSKYKDFERKNVWLIRVLILIPAIIIFLIGVGIGYGLDDLLTF